jgi:hypothetical protein
MAIVFALPKLYEAVVARFADEGTVAVQAFGWRAPAEQVRAQRRIVWIPGDEGGNLGAISPPRYVGKNPRQIATLLELCTVEIYAFDAPAGSKELAQYQVARELYDAWVRAVDLEAAGTYQITSTKWLGGDRTLRAGASIRSVLALQSPILDEPIATAPLDVGAALGVEVYDVGEQIEIASPTT